LDEGKIYGIFRDYIFSIINLHAPNDKGMGFGVLVKELLQKDKLFLNLGYIKYTYTSYNKDNHRE